MSLLNQQINTTMLNNQQQTTVSVSQDSANSIGVIKEIVKVSQGSTNPISGLPKEISSINDFWGKLPKTFSLWERYEQTLPPHSKQILNVLNDYSLLFDSKRNQSSIKIITMPDEWILLRKDKDFNKKIGLQSYSSCDDVVQTKEKSNKKDQMKLKNIKEKFKNKLKEVLNNTNVSKKNTSLNVYKNNLSNDDIIEIKLIQILIYVKSIIDKSIVEDKDLYDIWFGYGKFINVLEKFKLHDGITNQETFLKDFIINDLKTKYNEFFQKYKARLNYLNVCTNYAELFLNTSFDKILPNCSLKPYESQIEFLRFVNDNIKKPYVCVYNTIMGSGKTSIIAAFATIIKDFNEQNRMENKTLIYVCPEALSAVREMVGSFLFTSNMKFAIASVLEKKNSDGSSKISISEQNICLNSKSEPLVILTSVVTLIEMLKKSITVTKSVKSGNQNVKVEYELKPSNYVVFFDENTVTLDSKFSPMIKYLSELYQSMPSQIIFSSATHMPIENLDRLKEYVSSKTPETVFRTIDYSEVKIGTQLYNMNGKLIIPHEKCTTVEQLEHYIRYIRNKLMYKKFYTFKLVISMYNSLVRLGFGDHIPDQYHFDTYMHDFSHRNQESIQNLGIIYLELVVKFSGEEYFFSRFYSKYGIANFIELFNEHHDQVGFNYDNLIECVKKSILRGQTFVSCSDPYKEMMSKFGDHLIKIKREIKFDSFKKLVSNYNIKKDNAKKEANIVNSSNKTNKLEILKEAEYNKTFITDNIFELKKFSLNNTVLGLENINSDNIPETEEYDNLLLMALLGIVIFSKKSNTSYNDMVKNLISNGNCCIIFADSSLNYGNSFPFNNGIILDEMANHSANTLLQLMGRAGRVGLSSYANIYAGDLICRKLFDPIYNHNYIDWEKININKSVRLAICKESEKLYSDYLENFKEKLRNNYNVINDSFLEYIKILTQTLDINIEHVISDMNIQQQLILKEELTEIYMQHNELKRPYYVANRLQELSKSEDFVDSEELKEISLLVEKHKKNISNFKDIIINSFTEKLTLAEYSLRGIIDMFKNEIKSLTDKVELDRKYSIFEDNLSTLFNQTVLPFQTHVQSFVKLFSNTYWINNNSLILLSTNTQDLINSFDKNKTIYLEKLNTAKSKIEETIRLREEEVQIKHDIEKERKRVELEREHTESAERAERTERTERTGREADINTSWKRGVKIVQTVQPVQTSQSYGRYVPPSQNIDRYDSGRIYESTGNSDSYNWRSNFQNYSKRTDTDHNSSLVGSWRSNSYQNI